MTMTTILIIMRTTTAIKFAEVTKKSIEMMVLSHYYDGSYATNYEDDDDGHNTDGDLLLTSLSRFVLVSFFPSFVM